MDGQSTVAAADALQVSLMSSNVSLDFFESDYIGFTSTTGSEDLGKVDASVSITADDLVIHRLSKRVQAGADVRFRIAARVRQQPEPCTAESFRGVVRVLQTEIELVFGGLATALQCCHSCATCDESPAGCVDLVVSVPEDAALGSEVILRRVSVAGCDVSQDEALVRVIVGFNHEPAPAGRVFAAAQAGDIPALTQALDNGCSTQEANEVSVYAVHAPLLVISSSLCHGTALL
jgi:hypothetical protein